MHGVSNGARLLTGFHAEIVANVSTLDRDHYSMPKLVAEEDEAMFELKVIATVFFMGVNGVNSFPITPPTFELFEDRGTCEAAVRSFARLMHTTAQTAANMLNEPGLRIKIVWKCIERPVERT